MNQEYTADLDTPAGVAELAARYRLGRSTICHALAAGTVPGRKIGNTWTATPRAIEEAICYRIFRPGSKGRPRGDER